MGFYPKLKRALIAPMTLTKSPKKFFPVRSELDYHLSVKGLIEALVREGHLSTQTAADFLIPARTSVNSKIHPLILVAAQNWNSLKNNHPRMDVEWLGHWLAGKCELEYINIDPLKIDVATVAGLVSHAYATRFGILPVAVDKTTITMATAEPFLRDWEQELSRMLRLEVKRVIANPEEIARFLPEFYNLSRFVKQAMAQNGRESTATSFEQLTQLSRSGNVDANDHHIVSLVDWLFQYAFEQRASDIHLEPRRDKGNVRFRIDGLLHSVYQVPSPVMIAIISRIKALSRMDLIEKRRPQDGRIKTKTPDGREIELRLSTLPTAFGEKMVMRIFDPSILIRNFRELGFSEEDHKTWHRFISQPHGIVLVTGPTGSGKTTTLYTTLKQLATDEVNVCTVEDPIEMIEPSFNQMQVQTNIDLDFASSVRTLMRQDPDIIMIGEIRDRETADMAIQAALTGHLVLSTLHTNDATSSIVRLLDLGVPPYLISATVIGVMAQRLIRTLCPHCKEATTVDEILWKQLIAPWTAPPPATVYRAKGCLECRMTGFLGRIGLYEMLPINAAMRQLIAENGTLPALKAQARKDGVKPLNVAGAMKVAAGVTTLEEVLKVVPNEHGHA